MGGKIKNIYSVGEKCFSFKSVQ